MARSTSDDIERALLAMGLDEKEAHLYALLVERGPSTVGALAPAAGLSRTKAYSVLDGMVAQGFATMAADRPRTYAAADPDRLVRRRSQDLGSASRVIRSKLVPLFDGRPPEVGQSSLQGIAVLRRAEEMLGRAKNEIVLVAAFLPREAASMLAPALREVHARGVRVRTVMSRSLMEDGRLRRLGGVVDCRVRSGPRAGMLIVDDQEVLIGSLSERCSPDGRAARGGGGGGRGRDSDRLTGIWSRDAELVKLQRMAFDRLYSEGA